MSTQLEILTAGEVDRLASLEQIVDRGVQTFVEVGNALRAIRDERLYRQSHGRFEDYLRERWDMSRSRGYQLIDAAGVTGLLVSDSGGRLEDDIAGYGFEVVDPVSTIVDTAENGGPPPGGGGALPPPSNELVARRLAATARTDPDRAREIWAQALEKHGPDVSADEVAQIANGNGSPEVLDLWEIEAKAFLSDVRKAIKHKDPKDARRALARWRKTVYGELDRIARADQ